MLFEVSDEFSSGKGLGCGAGLVGGKDLGGGGLWVGGRVGGGGGGGGGGREGTNRFSPATAMM